MNPTDRNRMRLIDNLGLAFGFLFCGGVAGLCAYLRLIGERTNTWPKRKAKIVESKLAARIDSERMTSYVPKIRYEYELNGRLHTGSEIHYRSSPVFQIESDAKAFTDRFPVGLETEVRIDPANPSQSVLIPGALPRVMILIVTGILGMIFFGAMLIRG